MNFGEENIENVPHYKFVFAYFPTFFLKKKQVQRTEHINK